MGRLKQLLVALAIGSVVACVCWNNQYFTKSFILPPRHTTEYISINVSISGGSYLQPISILRVSNLDHAFHIDQPYLLLLPDNITVKTINQSVLAEAVKLFGTYESLNAIAGLNSANQTVYCSGSVTNWTLYLSHDRDGDTFQAQQTAFNESDDGNQLHHCQQCFLLPYGPIFFRFSAFLKSWKKLQSKAPGGYSKYGVGFLYSLLISLNSTGAHCSGLNFMATANGSNPSSALAQFSESDVCSQTFGFAFDQKFPLLADLLGVYRIVLPGGTEAWLDCEWDHRLLNSSASCADWLFRYLHDSIQLFKQNFSWDYRLIFGSALGAVRDRDIIPWTTDLDLIPVPFPSGKPVNMKAYENGVQKASGNMYDYITIDGEAHYAPYRMVPRCPIILNGTYRTSPEEMDWLNEVFTSKQTTKQVASSWRNLPYVDVYEENHLSWNHNASHKDNLDTTSDLVKVHWSEIRGVPVKSIGNPEQYFQRWFGPGWATPPQRSGGFTSRIESFV